MSHKIDAVFFISFGGPEKREDIRPFLEIVTRGRPIPPERIDEVAHHYELMGGSSPINAITRRQADGLRQALANSDTPWPVYLGNRNWHPFIEDTLKKMAADGVRRAIGFCTAAQRSESSLERYVNAVESARQKIGPSAPDIDYVATWFDHPLFIQAIAARAKDQLALVPESRRKTLSFIFTAHSIPCGMAKESTYVLELQKTAELVSQELALPSWKLAYSSRSGNPRDPWLEPDICDEIKAQAKRGIKDIFLIPIGFIADHVEILFDLDVEAKEAAQKAGVALYRSQTVGDHPLFIKMITDVVRQRATQESIAEMTSSRTTRLQDGKIIKSPGKQSKVCYCQPDAANPPCCQPTKSAGGFTHHPKSHP
jgi:ferrochelatase